MKNLITYLKALWRRVADSQSTDVSVDRHSTVVRPSFDCRSSLLKLVSVLVLVLTLGSGNAWGADTNVTINFGTASGNWAAQTNASFTDSDSRSWSRTYSAGGKTSGGTQYSQFGNSSNTCTSLVLTATAGKAMTLKTFTVTMQGASSSTAGTIYLYKRTSGGSETQLGTATVSGTTSVTCSMSSNTSFAATDILKVDYVGTAKSLKVTQLTYSYGTAAANVTLHWATNGSGGTSTSTQAQSATLPEKSDLNCSWNFIGWMPSEYTGKSSSGMISAGQTAGANTNLYALYSHPTHGSTNTLSTSPRIYTVTQSNSNATESTYNYDCVSNVETDIVNYYGAASGYALSATTPTVTVGGVAVDPSNIMWDITGDYGDGPSYPGYLWISLDGYFGGNVVINVVTELVCSSSVTIETGSPTNCTISASAASVSTCSGTRQVTVSVTPNSCYAGPTDATIITKSGTSATLVSGPTLNSGHYDYVYSFAENATGTATFNASLSTKTTYTVNYNKGTYGTGSNSSATKTCGVNLALPSSAMFTRDHYTQTGWSTAAAGNTKTYNLGANYTTDAGTTLYPYWEAEKYTVTWSVNGSTYQTTSNVSYNTTTSTPANPPVPVACDGSTFMGWTATENYTGNSAPGNMFNGTSPTITGDITFYAVFADED